MSWGKIFKITALMLIIIIVVCAGGLYFSYNNIYLKQLHSPTGTSDTNQRFMVNQGDSFTTAMRNLETHQLIKDHRLLKVFARLNPTRTAIKAGEYWLSPNMTPVEIVDKLIAGDVIQYSVTFPEGLTVNEMSTVWEESGYGTAKAFLEAVSNYQDSEWDVPTTGWEGYLHPETYSFPREFSEPELIRAMISQFKNVMKPEWLTAARELSLDRHQVVSLAALIEEETSVASERFLVSAVFHNRLKRGMLLQCDPTVIYALGDEYSGRLLKRHLSIDSPFNTYRYSGLPPGPISAPGKRALEAACFPDDVDFLYFVADNKGGHRFSRTLREHNQAVRDYRQGLKRK